MCGRITQPEELVQQLGVLGLPHLDWHVPETYRPSYNGAPSTSRLVILPADEHGGAAEALPWSYLSPWAKAKGLRPAINARSDKLSGGYYKRMVSDGRILVPAAGWYEWTSEGKAKQPWYISAAEDGPLFFAGLTNYRRDHPRDQETGFVIVTAASGGGMVDIHDRRPVALPPAAARAWLDRTASAAEAIQLIDDSLPPEAFTWHRVSQAVNKVGAHGPELIAPITASTP